ncbi:transcription-repair coupling factor [Anopheles sinensis]|uniref:Transcription-repair coupling factor n=1 Tax=Anopheles sinensis TaxID=74873 RepID=A0A084W831_ANOSI|nr:transcription-repair coupling factor [Anopheles sinensis]
MDGMYACGSITASIRGARAHISSAQPQVQPSRQVFLLGHHVPTSNSSAERPKGTTRLYNIRCSRLPLDLTNRGRRQFFDNRLDNHRHIDVAKNERDQNGLYINRCKPQNNFTEQLSAVVVYL